MNGARGPAALVAELQRRRPGFTPELHGAESGAVAALDQILARYLATIDERLGQATERQQLAQLDQLGVSLTPAQSARAPVVFTVAPDVVPGRVPPGTRLAADPPKPEATAVDPIAPPEQPESMPPGPISFETEDGIGLIAGSIDEVRSLLPGRDQAIDHTVAHASGQPFRPWNLSDLEPMPHHLYIAHKTLIALAGSSELRVRFEVNQGGSEPLSALWEYWDGGVWRPFRNSSHLCDPESPDLIDTTAGFRQSGVVTLTTDCAETKALELSGIENFWIRARLSEPVLPDPAQLLPEIERIELSTVLEHAIATKTGPEIEGGFSPDTIIVDGVEADVSKPFYPFGQNPKPGAVFLFSAGELFAKPGARVDLRFIRTVTPQDVPLPGGADQLDPTVAWEYWNGTRWTTLTTVSTTTTGGRFFDPTNDSLTSPQSGKVAFTVPDDFEPTTVADIEARWIRVRLVSGGFGYQQTVAWLTGTDDDDENEFTFVVPRPPALSDFKLGFRWEHGPFLPEAVLAYNDFQYRNETDAAIWPGQSFKPFTAPEDLTPAIYLGFDRPLPLDRIGFFLDVAEEIGEEPGPALIWEHWDGGSWRPLSVDDETRRLRKSGLIGVIGPNDSRPLARFGVARYWLRARLKEDGPPGSPEINRLAPNAVWAVQRQTVIDDPIGTSVGAPDQVYRFRQFPVLSGERIEVRELAGPRANTEWRIIALELWPGNRRVLAELEERIGREGTSTEIEYGDLRLKRDRFKKVTEVWVRWIGQPDLLDSTASERHYTLDRATGRLQFGNGAKVPPPGAPIVARRYRTGGGSIGNLPAGSISTLLGAISGVDAVSNPVPAGGGADGETVAALRDRGPHTLRHRGRGLAATDLAALAREASPAVAMARALPTRAADGRRRAGFVTIVITPTGDEPRPWPSFGLREEVRRHLESRGAAAIAGLERIEITGPGYQPVDVEATIVPRDPSDAGLVEQRCRAVLMRFLHPTLGGPENRGWAPGRDCWRSDVAAVLERVEGVDVVTELHISVAGRIGGERVGIADDRQVVAGTLRLRLVAAARGRQAP